MDFRLDPGLAHVFLILNDRNLRNDCDSENELPY